MDFPAVHLLAAGALERSFKNRSPGRRGAPDSFHSFSQFHIPYASFGNGNPS